MKTKASVKFGLVDVTAKSDSSLAITDKQSFVDVLDLKSDDIEEVKYGTLEKNQFALDGTFKLMPQISELDNMGWWSNSMSGSDGNFATPLTMTIDFTETHSSLGLTFLFSETNDYCNHLNIKFYDVSDELISSKDFYPDNYYYFCKDITENYQKIVITFYSTNNPYRYLKLYKILYGAEIVFEGDNLMSANLLEEVDLLSNEISINTLDFTCYSQDDDFNILNPQGAYRLLQQRQPFSVTETFTKQNKVKDMGTFYLDTWESEKDKTMKFGAIDLIGIIDKTEFNGGMYINKTVQYVIDEIFTSASLEANDYEIANDIKDLIINGYIPICTHREALQQVVFSIGAVADCSRSDKIKIYKTERTSENITTLDKTRTLQGTKKVEQGTIVTGVSVTSHNYVLNTEQEEVFKGELSSGTSKVVFSKPVSDLTITGGTILENNCNYAIINVATSGEVVINGYKYVDNMQTYYVEVPNLSSNQKQNVLKIEDATLINRSNATDTAQRVLDFYQKGYNISLNMLLEDEVLTESINIDEDFEQQLIGQITKLDIDLTGGFISSSNFNAKVMEASDE